MIELLIAITVFLIGIMAAFSLSLNNLNNAKENSNRVIAADLAREGIELVRNIRDSNWLAREANADSDTGTLGIQIYEWDHGLRDDTSPSINNFTIDHLSGVLAPLGDPAGTLDIAINLPTTVLNFNGDFYNYGSGQPTFFRRAINLKAICLTATGVEQALVNNIDCAVGETKIGLQITSRVRYTYGSRTNTIDAVENIYNWRQ